MINGLMNTMDEHPGGINDNGHDEPSSFGIKKIIDVRVRTDGKQMYKVKWEATWEPVENLASCQHLIDEFWSFVNKAKVHEGCSRKRAVPTLIMNTNMNMNPTAAKFPRLPEDDKSEVQRLIARTNQTSVGNPTLVSPNVMFNQQQQHHQISNPPHPNFQNSSQKPKIISQQQDQKPFSTNSSPTQNTSSSQKSKIIAIPKADPSFSPGGKDKSSSNSALKYVENFENPYVKIILVCKICNKEQSLKFSSNWKKHYLSHASNEEKPHHCPHCSKAFITLTAKNKHMKTHESATMMQPNVKEEEMYSMY